VPDQVNALVLVPGPQKPKMTDAPKIGGHNMVEEQFQKLNTTDGFCLLLIIVFPVTPAKSHPGLGNFYDTCIANGHPVGVPAKVFHHRFGRAESLFGI